MKKILSIFMAFITMLSFAACKNEEDNSEITVIIPAELLGNKGQYEIMDEAEENGFISCEFKANGSVKYVMTKEKHNEMLEKIKLGFDEGVKSLTEGEEKIVSFTSVEYNDDFTEVNIYVDGEQYTIWDSLYAMTFYYSGAYYQCFAGVNEQDIDVVVNFINNETQEIIDTSSYKEYQQVGAQN